ncbi:MAG: VWA domain-containing protein [Clostridiales bacterium]|nr:VWA domain-containing protein [Clostridiales bacterium]
MKKIIRSILQITVAVMILVCSALPAFAATGAFDTVLVLDVSGSMSSDISDMKSSAISFCTQILNSNSSNQIAVVTFETSAKTICSFTSDLSTVTSAINGISSGNLTNMYDAVVIAYDLITSSASTNSIKNLIIMADGYPCSGTTSANGKYTNEGYTTSATTYCNSIYSYVSSNIHPIASVYTVGYYRFNSSNPTYEDEKLCVEFMNDLANASSYFPTSSQNMFDDAAQAAIAAAETTTAAPVTTTKAPETTTKAPVTTTKAPETTTKAPETTTVPETTTEEETTAETTTAEETSAVISDNVALSSRISQRFSGMSTGAKVGIAAVAVVGLGGIATLLIVLLTKKPKAGTTPTSPLPVVLPVADDDDDDDNENQNYNEYETPAGIDRFASDVGAAGSDIPVLVTSCGTIYGVSGSYRGDSLSVNSGETVTIGRDPVSCNLVITEDKAKVSRVHCSVAFNADKNCFTVTDLSKNGTSTKAAKLVYNVPVDVPIGTEIQLADSSNIFRLG